MATRRRSGRGHSRDLDRKKILDAALGLARSDGFERLSMRKIATALGVDVSALYWHFRDKGELLHELEQRAAEGIEWPESPPGPWRERCLVVCRALRDQLRVHPELALHGRPSAWITPFNAKAAGRLGGILEEAGAPVAEAPLLALGLLHLVTAITASESATAGLGEDQDPARFVRAFAEALPPAAREQWRSLARRSPTESFDAYFELAVGIFLDGIEARGGLR